jgi:hypothetical protein
MGRDATFRGYGSMAHKAPDHAEAHNVVRSRGRNRAQGGVQCTSARVQSSNSGDSTTRTRQPANSDRCDVEARRLGLREQRRVGFPLRPLPRRPPAGRLLASITWVPFWFRRTCVAIAGADYCVVAADTRLSVGYSILTRDHSKICEL